MNTTNYWDQMSGDSKASPFNQENWSTGFMDQLSQNYNPLGQAGNQYGGKRQNYNDDHQKQALNYGGNQGFGAEGQGYWSGGSPGAGSWMEQLAATPAAAVKPPAAEDNSGMVGGAPSQIPSRTPAQADISHWDTPYAGRYQAVNQMYDQYLDRDSEEGGWQGWEATIDEWFRQGMTGDQINQRLAHEFQSSPEYQQRVAAGSSPAYSGTWGAPAAAAPTNPWISGGGSSRMNIRQY